MTPQEALRLAQAHGLEWFYDRRVRMYTLYESGGMSFETSYHTRASLDELDADKWCRAVAARVLRGLGGHLKQVERDVGVGHAPRLSHRQPGGGAEHKVVVVLDRIGFVVLAQVVGEDPERALRRTGTEIAPRQPGRRMVVEVQTRVEFAHRAAVDVAGEDAAVAFDFDAHVELAHFASRYRSNSANLSSSS